MNQFFGPLFRFEILRLSRTGQQIRLRMLLTSVLLVVLFFVYGNWFPQHDPVSLFNSNAMLSINDMARFAGSFVYALMMVQLFAVLLLTPIYVGAGITEEIQRRTVEFLLATELSSREILLGKLFARMLFVFGILLSGVPILALSLLWGGVSFSAILQSYIVVLMTMFLLAAYTLHRSVQSGDIVSTLMRSYQMIVVFGVGGFCCGSCLFPILGGSSGPVGSPAVFSPIISLNTLFHFDPDQVERSTLLYSLGCLFLGTFFLWVASHELRSKMLQHIDRKKSQVVDVTLLLDENNPIVAEVAISDEAQSAIARWEMMEDDPLFWKEARHLRHRRQAHINDESQVNEVVFFMGIVMMLILLFAYSTNHDRSGSTSSALFRIVGIIVTGIWIITCSLRSASCITRERERETLLPLLTLPMDRVEILDAKRRMCWIHRDIFLWLLGFLLLLATMTGALPIPAFPLLSLYIFGMIRFTVNLGIWLSCVCSSSLRASLFLMMTWFLFIIVPYLLSEATGVVVRAVTDRDLAERMTLVVETISPFSVWNHLLRVDASGTHGNFVLRLVGAAISTVMVFALAKLFWFLARRRLEREGYS